jgi:hypothetical protein
VREGGKELPPVPFDRQRSSDMNMSHPLSRRNETREFAYVLVLLTLLLLSL